MISGPRNTGTMFLFPQRERAQGSSSPSTPHSLAQQALPGSASPKHGQAAASPGTHAAHPQHHPQGLVLPPSQCHPQRQQAQQPSGSSTRTHGPALQCQRAQSLYSSGEKQPLPQRHRRWQQRAPAQQRPAGAAATAAVSAAGHGRGRDGRGHQEMGPGARSEEMSCLGISGSQAQYLSEETKPAHQLLELVLPPSPPALQCPVCAAADSGSGR